MARDSAGYAFIRQSEDTDESVEEWEDTSFLFQGYLGEPALPIIKQFSWLFCGKNLCVSSRIRKKVIIYTAPLDLRGHASLLPRNA